MLELELCILLYQIEIVHVNRNRFALQSALSLEPLNHNHYNFFYTAHRKQMHPHPHILPTHCHATQRCFVMNFAI